MPRGELIAADGPNPAGGRIEAPGQLSEFHYITTYLIGC